MGLSRTDFCSLCSGAIETISHIFWNCPITKRFINEIQNSLFNNSITITKTIFLFGSNEENTKDFNHVFIYAKYYIFSIKEKSKHLSLPSFRAMLQQIKRTEELMFEKVKKQKKKKINFSCKWSLLQGN